MDFIDLFWIFLFLLYYFIFWIENKLSHKKIFFVIFSVFFCLWYIPMIFTLPSNPFLLVLLKYSFVVAILFFVYIIISIFRKRSPSVNDLTLSYVFIVYLMSRFIIPAHKPDSAWFFFMFALYTLQKIIYIINLLIQIRRFTLFLRRE